MRGGAGQTDCYLPMGNLLCVYAAMRALQDFSCCIMRGKAQEKLCVAEMTCNFFLDGSYCWGRQRRIVIPEVWDKRLAVRQDLSKRIGPPHLQLPNGYGRSELDAVGAIG